MPSSRSISSFRGRLPRRRIAPRALTHPASLPGYLYSSRPPTDREYDFDHVARLMHTFMLGLGYGAGYATQGAFRRKAWASC